MKTSIKYLPKARQEELNFLTELICANVKNCEKIILFGSYARDAYVFYDETLTKRGSVETYQSDYDIFVVVSGRYVKYRDNIMERKVVGAYDKRYSMSIHPPVSIMVEELDKLNKYIDKQRYFYMDLLSEGILLYDSGKIELNRPKPLTYSEIKEITMEEYGIDFKKSEEFYYATGVMYDKEYYNLAAFMLHQTCENLFRCVSLAFVNKSPKCHRLEKLEAFTKQFSQEVATVFYKNGDFEKHCFELLCEAYVDGRYNPDYVIKREELDYLMERREELRTVVASVCEKRFIYYDEMIEKEENENNMHRTT